MFSSNTYRFMAALIAALCALPAFSARPQETAPAKLQLEIIEGEGAINNVRERTAREPIVQVTDENNRPVAGATVFFMLPDSGATATFPDGTHSLRTVTNKQGQAIAKGLKANDEVGRFQIRIEASYQNLSVSGTLNQANAILTSSAAAASSGTAGAGGARAGGGGSATGTGTAGGTATSGGGISTKVIVILAIAGAAAAGGVVAATSGGDSGSTTPPTQPPAPTIIRPGNPSFGAP
jgi:hypothetical protein